MEINEMLQTSETEANKTESDKIETKETKTKEISEQTAEKYENEGLAELIKKYIDEAVTTRLTAVKPPEKVNKAAHDPFLSGLFK